MSAYRQLAVVEPLPDDPAVRALRLAGARSFERFGPDTPACTFCGSEKRYLGPPLTHEQTFLESLKRAEAFAEAFVAGYGAR